MSWSDGKIQSVESCLEGFVKALPLIAKLIQVERIERERRWKEWEEERRRAEEAERRRAIEKALGVDLKVRTDQWKQAGEIQEFLRAVEMRFEEVEMPADDFRRLWLSWSRHWVKTLEDRAFRRVGQVLMADPRAPNDWRWRPPQFSPEEVGELIRETAPEPEV